MAEVRDLIRSLGTGGRTVLLSSHLLHEVEQVCDSVAILSKGRLIAQGNVEDLVRPGGDERVRLRTTDNARAVAGLGRSWAGLPSVEVDGDSLLVAAASDRSPEISTALGQAEVYVTEMAAEETTLEQYFLDVTEGERGGVTGANFGSLPLSPHSKLIDPPLSQVRRVYLVYRGS